jgi:hypothetical protein
MIHFCEDSRSSSAPLKRRRLVRNRLVWFTCALPTPSRTLSRPGASGLGSALTINPTDRRDAGNSRLRWEPHGLAEAALLRVLEKQNHR